MKERNVNSLCFFFLFCFTLCSTYCALLDNKEMSECEKEISVKQMDYVKVIKEDPLFNFHKSLSSFFISKPFLEILIVIFTNASSFPSIYYLFKQKLYIGSILGILTFLVSSIYHFCQIFTFYNYKFYFNYLLRSIFPFTLLNLFSEYFYYEYFIFGMNEGKWHKLDNIFIILSIQNLFIYLCIISENDFINDCILNNDYLIIAEKDKVIIDNNNSNHYNKFIQILKKFIFFCDNNNNHNDNYYKSLYIREYKLAQSLQWSSCFLSIFCQEISPWEEFYTFLPILFTGSYCVIRRFFFLEKVIAPTYDKKNLLFGGILLMIGWICFIKGLNNEQDILKIWHGMWHLFVGIAFYCLMSSKRKLKGI
ncbi:hypothetical protein ABK040_006820 [Willaertia magna]